MELPIFYQRLEGIVLFLAATYVYFDRGFCWLTYLILLFAFDIFMVGYFINNKIGAHFYNIGHSLILPILVVIIYVALGNNWLLALACVWFAHIGIDRAMGYGLKSSTGFKHTHLGDIGK